MHTPKRKLGSFVKRYQFPALGSPEGGGDQSSRQLQEIFIRFQGLDIEQCKNNYNEFDSSLKGVIGMHAILDYMWPSYTCISVLT